MSTLRANTITDVSGAAAVTVSGGLKTPSILDASGGNTATINGYIPVSPASPAFTGTPTAPTAADGTNTTQIATTAFSLLRNANLQAFTISDNWTKPAGATLIFVRVWGAGGGGAGGQVAGAGVLKDGGYAGTGAAYFEKYFLPSALTATVTVTVGAGGDGGASALPGQTGNLSSFGSYITCGGGRGGLNGFLRTGGAAQGAGTSASSLIIPSLDGSGGADAYYGGAGNSSFPAVGYSSQFGGGCGGTGGGETAANALVAPFAGGQSNYNVGGLAGTSVAGAPTAGGAGLFPGCGGGGGGSAQTANGANGGAGGFPGGGGGGGGSTRTGFLGGTGGKGGAGYVEVWWWT